MLKIVQTAFYHGASSFPPFGFISVETYTYQESSFLNQFHHISSAVLKYPIPRNYVSYNTQRILRLFLI